MKSGPLIFRHWLTCGAPLLCSLLGTAVHAGAPGPARLRLGDGPWVLDIDYPVLNHIEVYLTQGQRIIKHMQQGNLEPYAQRLIQGRTHSFGLQLKPGETYDVYLRVANTATMVLPMTLNKPSVFHARALQEQMLQGLLNGLAACLLVYSLTQWLTLRDPLYAKYAILVCGSLLFSLLHFGIGSQYVWRGNVWAEVHMGGLSALIASTGSFLFNEQALAGPDLKPWLRRLMKIGAGITSASAVLYALDVIDIYTVTAIVSTIGLAPPLLASPGAISRARRGDSVGIYFLLAWATYFVTTFILIKVIKGRVDANFWTTRSQSCPIDGTCMLRWNLPSSWPGPMKWWPYTCWIWTVSSRSTTSTGTM